MASWIEGKRLGFEGGRGPWPVARGPWGWEYRYKKREREARDFRPAKEIKSKGKNHAYLKDRKTQVSMNAQ